MESGDIRADADPEDLLRAMSGICMATDLPGWNDRTGRLVDLFVDGLRYGAPNPALSRGSSGDADAVSPCADAHADACAPRSCR